MVSTKVIAEGNYVRPSLESPHRIETSNVILNDFVESFFESIGDISTSDIQIKLAKNLMDSSYWIFAKKPAQIEWAVVSPRWYLDQQVKKFWDLSTDLKEGKRLTIIDDKS